MWRVELYSFYLFFASKYLHWFEFVLCYFSFTTKGSNLTGTVIKYIREKKSKKIKKEKKFELSSVVWFGSCLWSEAKNVLVSRWIFSIGLITFCTDVENMIFFPALFIIILNLHVFQFQLEICCLMTHKRIELKIPRQSNKKDALSKTRAFM